MSKSVRVERMRENIEVLDFELSDEEMARIADLDTGGTLFSTTPTRRWSVGSTAGRGD